MILDTLENTPEVSPRTMANRNSRGADIIFATRADVITHSVAADIRPKTIMSFLRSILSDRCPPGVSQTFAQCEHGADHTCRSYIMAYRICHQRERKSADCGSQC